ncbi:hypothetical protein HMN09_00857700 [Mycena chlorophos]|uniref:Uncharacterized protein n=1 Tax=Mycena chlorophos TaxID=658473 RepID=A0A8H6SR62_MYCCL|nr:hypothetical protein HMN09_00857700 [Mycena chlorophos]
MSMAPETSSPLLPPELERVVFELAAENDARTTRSLMLVATRVRIWIEPLMYRLIYLDTGDLHAFRGLISENPTLGLHVQHLFLDLWTMRSDSPAGIALIAACPNVTNLALWTFMDTTTPIPLPLLPKLSRLSTDIGFLTFNQTGAALSAHLEPIRSLTHLDITNVGWTMSQAIEGVKEIRRARALPSLTHLALGKASSVAPYMDILRMASQLQVLCMYVQQPEDPHSSWEERIPDPRFCVVTVVNKPFSADWRIGAEGGRGLWQRAEERVAERRKKLARSPLLDNPLRPLPIIFTAPRSPHPIILEVFKLKNYQPLVPQPLHRLLLHMPPHRVLTVLNEDQHL